MKTKLIGLHGKMGSGKDTVLLRMQALKPDAYEQASFAAALKEATSALLGISVEKLEELKRDDSYRLVLGEYGKLDQMVGEGLTVRAVLQRMGTEVGRDIFGKYFWVDIAMKKIERDEWKHATRRVEPPTYVFTDARFENEALAIIDRGGEVWHIIGHDEDTGDHASETPLPGELIRWTINNTLRGDDFEHLDLQIAEFIR